jgi:hypothetical protein
MTSPLLIRSTPDSFVPSDTQVRTVLAHLLQAWRYAVALQRKPWDFAVELDSLLDTGCSSSDLRWLACQVYIDHAAETTRTDAKSRTFQSEGVLTFGKHSCFVLTEVGLALADSLALTSSENGFPGNKVVGHARSTTAPRWDAVLRELWVGTNLVKQFRGQAGNQELILTSFEELGWPAHIDDPLPRVPDVDPKRRIHDAINRLNRHQTHRLLRFRGNGAGTGVRWETADGASTTAPPDRH